MMAAVDPQVMRRCLLIEAIGVAALVTAALVPSFRLPWIMSAAASFVVLGLVIPATSRARRAYIRVYLPIFLALAVGNGVADGVTAGSLQQGVHSAVRMMAVYILLVVVFEIVARRSRNTVSSPDR